MKLYYYFQVGSGYDDLFYILSDAFLADIDDMDIWLKRLSRDTNSIRVDAVNSSVIVAMFR